MYPNKLYQTIVFVTTTIYKIICIKHIILSSVKKRSEKGQAPGQPLVMGWARNGHEVVIQKSRLGHFLVKKRSKNLDLIYIMRYKFYCKDNLIIEGFYYVHKTPHIDYYAHLCAFKVKSS